MTYGGSRRDDGGVGQWETIVGGVGVGRIACIGGPKGGLGWLKNLLTSSLFCKKKFIFLVFFYAYSTNFYL